MIGTVQLECSGRRASHELIDYLAVHGLLARLVEMPDRDVVELGSAARDEEGLRSEVRKALRSWVSEHDGSAVLVEAAPGEFVLRPPAE
jgi:hypothetical protein